MRRRKQWAAQHAAAAAAAGGAVPGTPGGDLTLSEAGPSGGVGGLGAG
jgi:hypothetical protein